jgi:hypothetical protein
MNYGQELERHTVNNGGRRKGGRKRGRRVMPLYVKLVTSDKLVWLKPQSRQGNWRDSIQCGTPGTHRGFTMALSHAKVNDVTHFITVSWRLKWTKKVRTENKLFTDHFYNIFFKKDQNWEKKIGVLRGTGIHLVTELLIMVTALLTECQHSWAFVKHKINNF